METEKKLKLPDNQIIDLDYNLISESLDKVFFSETIKNNNLLFSIGSSLSSIYFVFI